MPDGFLSYSAKEYVLHDRDNLNYNVKTFQDNQNLVYSFNLRTFNGDDDFFNVIVFDNLCGVFVIAKVWEMFL